MTSGIDLYVFVERSVFDSDAAWLQALSRLAALDVPGLGLQVRTKSEPPERALSLAAEALAATRGAGAPVLLNGSTAEALHLGYTGVHWPEAEIPSGPSQDPLSLPQVEPLITAAVPRRDHELPLRPRGGRSRQAETEVLRGASVHSADAARRAETAGADFVVAGTIFDAGSKPVAGGGIAHLRDIANATSLPVLAIGGIRPHRVAACVEAGAAGVAVVTYVLRAPDMAAAVWDLRRALDTAGLPLRSG